MNALERRVRKLEEKFNPECITFAPLQFDPTKPYDPKEWVPPSERTEPINPRWQLSFNRTS